MDTEAIYQALCAYGSAKAARDTFEAWEHVETIKHLLKEAEDERAELLAENKRLHDQMEKQKDEWLSWQAKRDALASDEHKAIQAMLNACGDVAAKRLEKAA